MRITDVEILLKSSEQNVYVNDDQRIGFQKGAKWMREVMEEMLVDDISNHISKLLKDDAFIGNLCLSYRHDFGLLSAEEKDSLIFQCKEWMRAISNNMILQNWKTIK